MVCKSRPGLKDYNILLCSHVCPTCHVSFSSFGMLLWFLKHSEKFASLFGGQLISMNIRPRKEDRSYPDTFKNGRSLHLI